MTILYLKISRNPMTATNHIIMDPKANDPSIDIEYIAALK
jgi:hypothetical protein